MIDENPDVLTFFARLLDANQIRALLARNASDAAGIAERSYVPIDLILANVLLSHDSGGPGNGNGPDLIDRLRRVRPHVHALYMSAWVDSGVIRVELLEGGLRNTSRKTNSGGLVDTLRNAALTPRVRTAR